MQITQKTPEQVLQTLDVNIAMFLNYGPKYQNKVQGMKESKDRLEKYFRGELTMQELQWEDKEYLTHIPSNFLGI